MKVGKGQKYYSYGNDYYPYNEKYEAQSVSGRCRYPERCSHQSHEAGNNKDFTPGRMT